MKSVTVFLRLFARPLSILNLFAWVILWAYVAMLEKSEGWMALGVGHEILPVILLPGAAGLMLGVGLQELQASSFALTLPSVRRFNQRGFFVVGLLVVAAVTLVYAGDAEFPFSLTAWFALGMACFCLGGLLQDPISPWVRAANLALFVVLVLGSQTLSAFLVESPDTVFLVSVTVLLFALHRRFSRRTFRRRPLLNPKPQNLYSRASLNRFQRRQQASYGPGRSVWQPSYLGRGLLAWVKAAWHQTWGRHWVQAFLKGLAGSWGLALLVIANVWLDKGEQGFGAGLAWALHDGLMGSPHVPPFGEHEGLRPLFAIMILIAGAQLALARSVELKPGLLYPVSRIRRARISLAGSLLDTTTLLVIVSPVLFLAGHLAGWAAGFPPSFDYLPFFLRCIGVLLILAPFAYVGGLEYRHGNLGDAFAIGFLLVIGMGLFVGVGGALIWAFPRLLPAPYLELTGLFVAFVASRLLYWKYLYKFFTTQDLAH